MKKRYATSWTKLSNEDELALWERISRHFGFPWPELYTGEGKRGPCSQFIEPEPSVTYLVSHAFEVDRESRKALELDLNTKTWKAFKSTVTHGYLVYALNWNHQGYSFDPHQPLGSIEKHWLLPVLTDWNHYVFISENFDVGMLESYWDPSICIFGQPLIDAFEKDLPTLFKCIRTNGKGDCYNSGKLRGTTESIDPNAPFMPGLP